MGGGTGVTPFLTFLPKLLIALENQQQIIKQEQPTSFGDGLESGDGIRKSSTAASTTASFLWCCRDEALIRHVANTYLIPLFRAHPMEEHRGGISEDNDVPKVHLMIYN